mmetsp:Transcript_114361/g.160516  ORF Transcript_114361/g.160516 Transcript_114361/m.160516 type:complete len:105 (+) Transcript_114361:58-372(+)
MALAHTTRVCRLYRLALKTQLNWAVDRALFNEEALETRALFKKHMHETDPEKVERLISAGELRLFNIKHPDPYTAPVNEGGSKWQRNIPPPLPTCSDDVFREWL